MDPGAAAVLGAVVGVVGTASTALMTVRGLRWQTRQQHQFAVDQWRRSVRRDTYAQFLNREQAWSRAALDAIKLEGPEAIIHASEAMLPLEQAAFRALTVVIDDAREMPGRGERQRLIDAFIVCNNEQAAAARQFRRIAREVLDSPT